MNNARIVFDFSCIAGCAAAGGKLLALCYLLMPFAVFAEASAEKDCIVWHKSEEHYVQDPLEGELSFTFSFTNLCDEAIKFEYARPSAPGFSANLKESVVQPGETGSVECIYEIPYYQGKQRSVFALGTEKHGRQLVRLEVIVPTFYEIEGEGTYVRDDHPWVSERFFVRWVKGESEPEREIVLRNSFGVPVPIKGLVGAVDFLNAELETVKEGEEYALKLRPERIDENFHEILFLLLEFPKGVERRAMIIFECKERF